VKRYLGGVLASFLLLAGLLLASSAPAVADAIGPDQAQSLTTQLRDWLREMVGPVAPLPDLTVTAEGDHYRLAVPIAGLDGPQKDVTAQLRPLDAGRWAATEIRLPADTTLTAKLPPPKGETEPAAMRLRLAIADQHSHAEIDPTLAGPSTLVLGLRGIAMHSETAGRPQSQAFDAFDQTITLRPAAGNTLDIDQTGSADGWKSAQEMPDGRGVAVGARHLSGTTHVVGLDRTRAATLGPVLAALAAAPTPERNERLRALVTALHGLLTSLTVDETIEGMQIAVAGQGNATIDRLHLGFDSAAPDGNLDSKVSLGVEGLALPGLPPAQADLAPRHLKIGVSLAGISAPALNDLALAALQPGANPTTVAPQIDALFADPGRTGGPRLGLDSLGFDVGPAQVDAHGSVVAISQSDVRGTARITVTGFDALTDRIRDDPQLQQALPFLILARGMARSERSTLIWDIVFTPEGLTVNGVDPRNLLQQPKRHPKP